MNREELTIKSKQQNAKCSKKKKKRLTNRNTEKKPINSAVSDYQWMSHVECDTY